MRRSGIVLGLVVVVTMGLLVLAFTTGEDNLPNDGPASNAVLRAPGEEGDAEVGSELSESGDETSQADDDEAVVESLGPRLVSEPFGLVELRADFELDGPGADIDSLAFWEAPSPEDSLLLATSKAVPLVEVWEAPFDGAQRDPLTHPVFGPTEGEEGRGEVNGIVVDQERDLLYVSTSAPVSTLAVFDLPDLGFLIELNRDRLFMAEEPNLDLFSHSDGSRWLYLTTDHEVHVLESGTGEVHRSFDIDGDVETVLADEYWQRLYVPDEKDRRGIFVFDPDGAEFSGSVDPLFGSEAIDSDAEGILLYQGAGIDGEDDGSGFVVLSDQRNDVTEFEFFDRETTEHLGTLRLTGVSNTDGIASTQQEFDEFPMGVFAVVNDDSTVVGIGWERLLEETGLLVR